MKLNHRVGIALAAVAAQIIAFGAVAWAQTPPIQPEVQQAPLPPAVELPAPANRPADVPNRPLTADEAAGIALYHQPDISVATAGVLAAQGRVQQARSGLLPTFGAGTSYTNAAITPSSVSEGGPVSVVTSTGYQVTANVRQLLFDFNHTRDLVKQASAQQTAASANASRVRADVVLQVKQAFYTFTQNQRLVTVNEANLRNQQSHLAAAQARLDEGLGLPADVVRAQAAVAQAVLDLTAARNSASVARVNLAQLMGIDPRTPIDAAESGEISCNIDDLNALVNTAIEQRPELQQFQASINAAAFGVKAANSSNSPSIGATVGWLQRGSDFPPDRNSLTYGVALQWTPFDAGLTKGKVKEAQANLQSSRAQLVSQTQSVVSQVSQAYLNIKTSEQRVTTSEAAVANAKEALRLVDGRYSSGLGTFLDVLDAQTTLVTARTNRVNAQAELEQARAAMAHAIGTPVRVCAKPAP